ncbi:MAG: hypothetical protein AB1416_06585 [Actinomycetota bacterium]
MTPPAAARPVTVALAGACALAAAAPAVAAPSLRLTVDPQMRIDRPVVVRGVAGEAGRLVVVVRNANGRVLGRRVRTRVDGAFGVAVTLNDAARPGRVTVTAQLTGAGAFPPVKATARTEILKIEPNFLAAFPTTWPASRPLPVRGRLAFPGRLVIVVRDGDGDPLGRVVVQKAARGGFVRTIRLSHARPGPIRVTATLRSGSLVATGRGDLRLS